MKKVLLLGDSGVGKTSMLHNHMYGNTDNMCSPTIGVEVHPIRIPGTDTVFNIWDVAGHEKYGGLRQGYYVGADAAIIMGDNVNEWVDDVPGIPTMVMKDGLAETLSLLV